jgi:hypothetical protein
MPVIVAEQIRSQMLGHQVADLAGQQAGLNEDASHNVGSQTTGHPVSAISRGM